MKKTYRLIYLLILALVVMSCSSPERDYSNLPDQELTKDEAVKRIQMFQANVKDLQNKLAQQEQEAAALKNQLSNVNASIKDCNETYYQLIGATEADIEAFRQE